MSTVPLFGIYHDEAMEQAAAEVLRSRQIASGPQVALFEQEFGQLVRQAHVVSCNDMSNAMQLALRLSGVGAGDEVLTSAYACLSTNAPIAMVGAQPRWVDVDPATGNLCPQALERAITPRCKAVIAYHLAGYPARVAEIAAICKAHGLKLIEDCDNALLATVDGQPVGTFGDHAIYSFYPNRQVNASEGGALACRDPADAARARRLRRYGIDMPSFRDRWGEISPASDIAEVGYAATLNQLCAALGRCQLPGVADRLAVTRAHAAWLSERLAAVPGLSLVPLSPGAIAAYWTLLIHTDRRDALMQGLKSRGVQCSTLHLRNDAYSAFGGPQDLPGTLAFASSMLALPCGWWLAPEQLQGIVDAVGDVLCNP